MESTDRAFQFTSDVDAEWRNRLIWGHKKYVLPALLGELGGAIDLIYIDPPFATGADFSFMTQFQIPEAPSRRSPASSSKRHIGTSGVGVSTGTSSGSTSMSRTRTGRRPSRARTPPSSRT